MDLKIEFTDKDLTPWAGISLLKNMVDRMGFDSFLNELDLPSQGSNRGYSPSQLIQQFMTSVWCGANRFEHTEITRQDEVIRSFMGFDQWQVTNPFNDTFKNLIKLPTRKFLRSGTNGFLVSLVSTTLLSM